ncbi:unnamed protein product [Peronospora belbahrii]|uniref:FYVE-type domain-containing protein n=1 Tax=Peronospora belbahrii TaxID=622444 RepID=A0AAU9KKZ5_9STRA|nr:unnamed protein product [Peronospora belbahrii]CAH0515289.1 unnamed protein product [Peronospora belbahrii]
MLSSRRGRTLSWNDAKTFPVPEDFFPELELTDEQTQGYEMQVKKIVQDALVEYEKHEAKGAYPIYSAPWVPVGTENLLTAIRRETPERILHSEFRLYGRIHGNYRNFMDFHYAETSHELFQSNQFMYGYVVDAVVLKNIHTKDSGKTHEYMGIKWTCLQPSPFGRKQDNCFLEYLTYTKDQLGRNVGVRVTLPVEIDECPDLYSPLKIKRIKTQSVSIVRSAGSSSDATQLFIMSENNFAGPSVSAKHYKKLIRVYNDMSLSIDSKHILKRGIMCKTKWVPNDSRKACASCHLPFSAAMRHRHHCRLCGDVFCHQCVTIRYVPRGVTNTSRVFEVAKTHFCTACVFAIRRRSEASQARVSRLERSASTTHAISVQDLCFENKDCKLQKEASSIMEHSCFRPEWWDATASYNSESNWSETDSEDASKASLNASGRSLLASSLSSSQSSWTHQVDNSTEKDDVPFVVTLDVIDDDVAILDEKARSSKSRLYKKLSMSGQYSMSRRHLQKRAPTPKSSDDTLEITEVIDTVDMMPMSELQQQSGTAGGVLHEVAQKHSKRRSGRESCNSGGCLSRDKVTNRFRSSRSISQCLAEQEELLRCMLCVSQAQWASVA